METSTKLLALLLVLTPRLSVADTAGTGVEISSEDAKSAALKIVPGKVVEVEEEKYRGTPAISVEIKTAEGVHEIVFRKSDGKILSKEFDSEDDEEDEEEK